MEIKKLNRPLDVMGEMQEPISKPPLVKKIEPSQAINKDENPEGRKKKREEEYEKMQSNLDKEKEKPQNQQFYNEKGKKVLRNDEKGEIIDKMV